jgi:hypothetical protein
MLNVSNISPIPHLSHSNTDTFSVFAKKCGKKKMGAIVLCIYMREAAKKARICKRHTGT